MVMLLRKIWIMSLIPKRERAIATTGWMRGLALGVLLVASLCLNGCAWQQHEPGPEALNPVPIKTDQAMEKRLWSPSPTYYVNDSVVTWPDYAPFQSVALPDGLNFFNEPLLFFGNMFYIPAGVFIEPAWKEQTFKSQSPPPSFTLMPPLPAGPDQAPGFF
jgi:hypothetical protein